MQNRRTLAQLSPGDVCNMQEIRAADLRILWINDFYDGALSGIIEWQGRRHRFEMIDRSVLRHEDEHSRRRYWMIVLTPEQLLEEEKWHELFCTHVWSGFDYTGRPARSSPQSEHSKFYEPYSQRVLPDYSQNEVVGWFAL